MERLTDELEAEARDYIARIDDLGGMVAAVEAGFPQAEIAEASYVYQREFERGERLMVGVNAHVEEGGEEPDIHRADPEVERRQIEHLRAWREGRDAAAHAEALRRAARGVRG